MDFNSLPQGKKVVFPAKRNAVAKSAGTLKIGLEQTTVGCGTQV